MENIKNYIFERLKQENQKQFKKVYGSDWEKVFDFYFKLSKHDLEKVSGIARNIKEGKYERVRKRLLGTKSKAEPHKYFVKVLDHFSKLHGPRYKVLKMLFEVQGYEGMRIGDLLELKLENLDFQSHQITLLNHKSQRVYSVPMYPEVEKNLKKYVLEFEKEIADHQGYLFFSNAVVRTNNHISSQYANREYVAALKNIGVQKTYAISKNGRPLNLYTTHSNRGHAATQVLKKTHGNIRAVQKLLDHSPKSITTTGLYFEDAEDELFKAVRLKKK